MPRRSNPERSFAQAGARAARAHGGLRARLLEDAAARFAFGASDLDLASGRFVATESLLRLLQWTGALDTLDFASLRDAIVEPGRTALDLAIERARTHGTPWDFGARLRRAEGPDQFVQLRGAAIIADGRCVGLRGAVQLLPAASSNVETRDTARAQRGLVQRLELAAAAAGVGFFEVGPAPADNTWSARMCEIYGVDAEAPAPDRETWRRNFLHPDDAAAQAAALVESQASGTYEHEHRIIRADGVVRWVYSHAVADRESDGRHWLGIAMDITERKLAEQQLREALDRLALASKGSGVGVWQRDLDREAAHWSEELFRFCGLPVHARAPDWKQLVAMVHPEDRELFELQWQELARSTEFIDTEFRIRRADGSTRSILTRGRLEPGNGSHRGRVVGVALDITELAKPRNSGRTTRRAGWRSASQSDAARPVAPRHCHRHAAPGTPELRRLLFGVADDAPDPTLDQVLDSCCRRIGPRCSLRASGRRPPRHRRGRIPHSPRRRRDPHLAVARLGTARPRRQAAGRIQRDHRRHRAQRRAAANSTRRSSACGSRQKPDASRPGKRPRVREDAESRPFDFDDLPCAPSVRRCWTLLHVRASPQDRTRVMQAWTRVRTCRA